MEVQTSAALIGKSRTQPQRSQTQSQATVTYLAG